MSYTQYYCNEDNGMRLRSGKVINCLTTSTLLHEIKQAISFSHFGFNTKGERVTIITCFALQYILGVLEKFAEPIANDPCLFDFYKAILAKLPQLADDVKRKEKKIGEICTCSDFYPHFKKSHNKMLIKISKQRHANAESLNKLETLFNYFEKIRIYNEKKTTHALTILINKYNAKNVMSYL